MNMLIYYSMIHHALAQVQHLKFSLLVLGVVENQNQYETTGKISIKYLAKYCIQHIIRCL